MIKFDNTYTELPSDFYSHSCAQKVPAPKLLAFNKDLAKEMLGDSFNPNDEDLLAQLFTGQNIPASASSIALAYAGHQFGHFSPQLGDGRALLLGEVLTEKNQRFDIQLKGSGRTPYSRRGDGKSSLGPVIREYILSEAMHSLGVPTTRALAACSTGETVYREAPLPGGVFTRVAQSHIRVGTFEYFAARSEFENVNKLAHYTIERHYPQCLNEENIYLALIKEVAHKQASLVAHWMSFGFIHGVMNTDNMSITGETLDYGPCAFMDHFKFDKVFSSIDHHERYAYSNQIDIAKWNLNRFASCLIPLVHEDEEQAIQMLRESISSYIDIYEDLWLQKMAKKLGIFNPKESDAQIINTWLAYLQEQKLDFTLSFRTISNQEYSFEKTESYNKFFNVWQARLKDQAEDEESAFNLMKEVNPVFIPRNHQVENAIEGALNEDLTLFKRLNLCLKTPFSENESFSEFRLPPRPQEVVKATFCGT